MPKVRLTTRPEEVVEVEDEREVHLLVSQGLVVGEGEDPRKTYGFDTEGTTDDKPRGSARQAEKE